MIDHVKRKTLKTIVATGSMVAGSVVFGTAGAALSDRSPQAYNANDLRLANIEVKTRVSAIHNELEVVISNVGDATTLTHITPGKLSVARGEFDFSALCKAGPLNLDAGESVTVPLLHKPVELASAMQKPLVTDALRQSLSIVTDNNAFASVSVVGSAIT